MRLTRVLVMIVAVVLVAGCTPKAPKKDAAAPETKAPAAQAPVKEMPAKMDVKPKAEPAAEVWTCTMHPEVREAKAGKCPKCGMDLVKAPAGAKAPAAAPMAPPAAAPAPTPMAPAPAATPAPAAAPAPPAPAPAPAAK